MPLSRWMFFLALLCRPLMPDVIHHTHPKETGPNLYLEPFDDRQPTNHAKKSILKTVGPPTDCKPLAFPLHLDLGSFCWWETCKSQSPSQGAWYKEPLTKTKLWRHRKNQRFFSSCVHFHRRFGKNSKHLPHVLQNLLYLEWSPPWHFKTAMLDCMSAWSCQVRAVRHTAHLLKCVRSLSSSQTDWRQSSDILSGISHDILSDISSDILSGISTWSRLRSGTQHWTHMIAVEVLQGTLSSHHRSGRGGGGRGRGGGGEDNSHKI